MKYGVSLIVRGEDVGPETFDAMAQKAEAIDLDILWSSDHLVMMPMIHSKYPGTADGQMPEGWKRKYYQPFSTLNYVAARTSRIRIGTSVLILPMRNPIEVAAQVAELDQLSGGRASFGVGVGWFQEEYEALGYPFNKRGKRCNEGLEILKKLWTGAEAAIRSGDFETQTPTDATTPRIIEVLEKGLALAPRHGGLCHLYIHALEMGPRSLLRGSVLSYDPHPFLRGCAARLQKRHHLSQGGEGCHPRRGDPGLGSPHPHGFPHRCAARRVRDDDRLQPACGAGRPAPEGSGGSGRPPRWRLYKRRWACDV